MTKTHEPIPEAVVENRMVSISCFLMALVMMGASLGEVAPMFVWPISLAVLTVAWLVEQCNIRDDYRLDNEQHIQRWYEQTQLTLVIMCISGLVLGFIREERADGWMYAGLTTSVVTMLIMMVLLILKTGRPLPT